MDDLEVNPRILSAVKRANLASFSAVLSLSPADLERRTKLPANDVATLLKTVSREVYKNPSATASAKVVLSTLLFPGGENAHPSKITGAILSAQRSHRCLYLLPHQIQQLEQLPGLELYQGSCHKSLQTLVLSSGCEVLDEFLRGGILSRGITEIAGESAAGKTQLCMQLCLSVQRSAKNGGLCGGAVYVCTEDVFPSKRLHQLIQSFQKKFEGTESQQLRLGDNIFIEHVSERDQLVHCIQYRIPLLLQQRNVKLIVLDSLAALFRCEFSPGETARRARHLQSLGAQLHRLSQIHNVPVVCVNQVTANMSATSHSNGHNPSQRQLIPALGLTWSNLVQTRLMLSRTNYRLQPVATSHKHGDTTHVSSEVDPKSQQVSGGEMGTVVRSMEVVFAPHLPSDTYYFVVEADGVRGLR